MGLGQSIAVIRTTVVQALDAVIASQELLQQLDEAAEAEAEVELLEELRVSVALENAEKEKNDGYGETDDKPAHAEIVPDPFGYNAAARSACQKLFARPWWSRTWILQEVIHPRGVAVHIGDLEPVSLDDLCLAADMSAQLEWRALFMPHLVRLTDGFYDTFGRFQPFEADVTDIFRFWLLSKGGTSPPARTIRDWRGL
ncbi:hypothetical protein GGTG_06575 [Gaeumannomyces tritici R3-111a-1]|uniref:Heterokaryon incompatibility domain-containing protein n=1 Tax=Gaeumannomyces tritici (strain R3-111a-1) TaxID=644352 RepID=J3NZ75_GAET3|nr:hypothetical protein GGTG_06575 [Gaeumannomyces tritici R3-111a-1]EJT76658.1 hypothetical protein GGTG_06575 [Gaeumannomyces tritici R3-111a-1]